MTELDRLDRDLVAWFGEAATPHVPDYVDDIVRQTAPIRQRPRWTFPERWLPMTVVTLGRRTRRPVPWRTIGAIALVVVLLAAIVSVYVGTRPRPLPAPFGLAANGSIAYVKTDVSYENQTGYHEPYGDILAVDPATGTTTTLVGGPELDGQPVYSLDGSRLSFVRKVDEGFALYAMDVQSPTPTRLTKDAFPNIRETAWSPDGRTVAFTVGANHESDLWIASADGSGARKLALEVSGIAPQWRPPDGSELLFLGSAKPGLEALGGYHGLYGDEAATSLDLYLVRPDGTGLRRITSSAGSKFDYTWTSWTPDGGRIVTQIKNAFDYLDILVLDAAGGLLDRITAKSADAMAPLVSPDGSRMAYAIVPNGEGLWELHIRSMNRSGPEITSDRLVEGGASSYRWSPDGTLLIVNQHYYPGTWLVDTATGKTRKAQWTDPGYAAFQRLAQ
jgi:Tol biopolymer transport system component